MHSEELIMSTWPISRFAACLLVSVAGYSTASAETGQDGAADYTAQDVVDVFSCLELYNAPTKPDGTCGAPFVGSRGLPKLLDRSKEAVSRMEPAPARGSRSNLAQRTPRESLRDDAPVTALPQLPGERNLMIEFANNSAELTERAQANARAFATGLLTPQLKNVRFAIDGHTNSIGSETYNQELSLRRAKALVAYLEAQGVDSSRFEVAGYGESRPIDAENTESSENRRVEARRLDGPLTAAPAGQ
jgi:outer membrane protein OmpA-like peptidoglycan-associated protein